MIPQIWMLEVGNYLGRCSQGHDFETSGDWSGSSKNLLGRRAKLEEGNLQREDWQCASTQPHLESRDGASLGKEANPGRTEMGNHVRLWDVDANLVV